MTRKNLPDALGVIAGALSLTACQAQEPADGPAADTAVAAETAPADTPLVDIVDEQTYSCDDSSTVRRLGFIEDYGSDGGVRLEIDGEPLTLAHVPSGSGAEYSTEQGLTPDMLLVWWTKADRGMLIESPLDDSATEADDDIRARCKIAPAAA